MQELNDLHDQAMELADDADVAQRRGKIDEAQSLYRRAYELEIRVAHQVNAEPSRSIMYRSAASLAIECGLLDEAQTLALTGLAGQPPLEIYEELKEIIADVEIRRQASLIQPVDESPEVKQPHPPMRTSNQGALTTITQSTMRTEWAQTMMNLGNTYAERIEGDKAENIERAIATYKQALSILPKASNEQLWASLQSALGNALKRNYQGNREENIEAAIQAYEQALTVRTQSTMPTEWAHTKMNLGDAYRNRIVGNKAENIEAAIQAYEQALTVQIQSAVRVDWAATMNSQGNGYGDRIRGDRAENIETAIAAYNQALTVRKRDTMPVDWAQTMNNLGNAYAVRIRGGKAENIEAAIDAYKQALTVRKQETLPIAWAISMMNLGNAYRNRNWGDKAKNIETAIYAFNQARTEITPRTMPGDWATIMNNLGNAYAVRFRGDRAQNIEMAIAAYIQALTVRKQDTMPVDWAQTMNNVGNACAKRIWGDRAQNIEAAIDAYKQALTVRTRNAMPVEHRDTLKNIAQVYFGEKRWPEAYQTCLDAIDVGEDIFALAVGDAGRMDTIGVMGQLYICSAYSTLQSGKYDDALAQLEASKARLLAEAQSLGDANLTQLTQKERDLLQNRRERIRDLEYEYRLPTDNSDRGDGRDINDNLRDARAHLRELIEQFRDKYPDFMPEGLPLVDLLELIPVDGALVAPLFTSQGSAVFIVPHGVSNVTDEHVIMLDDFKREGLNELTRGEAPGWLRKYELRRYFQSAVRLLTDYSKGRQIGAAQIIRTTSFLREYIVNLDEIEAAIAEIEHSVTERSKSPSDLNSAIQTIKTFMKEKWLGQDHVEADLDEVTGQLWDRLVYRVYEKLESFGVERVLLMPQGDTNLLPLHAAWREVEGVRRYFIDDYTITYTPSMATLANAQRKTDKGIGALVAGVSDYGGERDLPNSRAEVENIAALFGVDPLLDAAVSVESVRSGSAGKAFLHLSCHGGFGWGGNAFASALYLGNDEVLPLPEIIAHFNLHQTRLVVLSACETGIVDVQAAPDEFVGLPAGFMQAGALAVVSSLWTVDDRSTALLMERMYKLILNENNPLEPLRALHKAQSWMRNATRREIGDYYQACLTNPKSHMSQQEAASAYSAYIEITQRGKPDDKPYAHPVYWGAFMYSGV
jgi:CHAT domain-containing protein